MDIKPTDLTDPTEPTEPTNPTKPTKPNYSLDKILNIFKYFKKNMEVINQLVNGPTLQSIVFVDTLDYEEQKLLALFINSLRRDLFISSYLMGDYRLTRWYRLYLKLMWWDNVQCLNWNLHSLGIFIPESNLQVLVDFTDDCR